MIFRLEIYKILKLNDFTAGFKNYCEANGIGFSENDISLRFRNLIDKVDENQDVTSDKDNFTKAVKLIIKLKNPNNIQKLDAQQKQLINKFITEFNAPIRSQNVFIRKANQFLDEHGKKYEEKLNERGVCSGLTSVLCEYDKNNNIQEYQLYYDAIVNYESSEEIDNKVTLLEFIRRVRQQQSEQHAANRKNSDDKTTHYEASRTFYLDGWKSASYKKMLNKIFEKDSDGNYIEKNYRFSANGHTTSVIVHKQLPFTYISTNNKMQVLKIDSLDKLAEAIRQAQFDDFIGAIENPYKQISMTVDAYPIIRDLFTVTNKQVCFGLLLNFIEKMDSHYVEDQLNQYNAGLIAADELFRNVISHLDFAKSDTEISNQLRSDFEYKYIEYLGLTKDFERIVASYSQQDKNEARVFSVAMDEHISPLHKLKMLKAVVDENELGSGQDIDSLYYNILLPPSNGNIDEIKNLDYQQKAKLLHGAVSKGSESEVQHILADEDFHEKWVSYKGNLEQNNHAVDYFTVALHYQQLEVAKLLLINNKFLPSRVKKSDRYKELGDYIKALYNRQFTGELQSLINSENDYFNVIREYEIHNLFFIACKNDDIDLIKILLKYKDSKKIKGSYNLMHEKNAPNNQEKRQGLYLYREGNPEKTHILVIHSNTSETLNLTDLAEGNISIQEILQDITWPNDNDTEVSLDNELVKFITSHCEHIDPSYKINFSNAGLKRTAYTGDIYEIPHDSYISYALDSDPIKRELLEQLHIAGIKPKENEFDGDDDKKLNYEIIISKIDKEEVKFKINEISDSPDRSTMLRLTTTPERSSASDDSPSASPKRQKKKLSNKDKNKSFFEQHKYKILVGTLIVAALLIGTGIAGVAGVGILSVALGTIMPLKFAALSPTVVPFLEGIACAAIAGFAAATAYGFKKFHHWLFDRDSEVEDPRCRHQQSPARNSLSGVLSAVGASNAADPGGNTISKTTHGSPISRRNSSTSESDPLQISIAPGYEDRSDEDSEESENSSGPEV